MTKYLVVLIAKDTIYSKVLQQFFLSLCPSKVLWQTSQCVKYKLPIFTNCKNSTRITTFFWWILTIFNRSPSGSTEINLLWMFLDFFVPRTKTKLEKRFLRNSLLARNQMFLFLLLYLSIWIIFKYSNSCQSLTVSIV